MMWPRKQYLGDVTADVVCPPDGRASRKAQGCWARTPWERWSEDTQEDVMLTTPKQCESKRPDRDCVGWNFKKNLSSLSKAKMHFVQLTAHAEIKPRPSRAETPREAWWKFNDALEWATSSSCWSCGEGLPAGGCQSSQRQTLSPTLALGSQMSRKTRRRRKEEVMEGGSWWARGTGSWGHQLSGWTFRSPALHPQKGPQRQRQEMILWGEATSGCLVPFVIWSSRFLYEFCRSLHLYPSSWVMYPFVLQREKIRNHNIFVFSRIENTMLQTGQAAGYKILRRESK